MLHAISLSIGVIAVVFAIRFLIYIFFLVVALIVLMRAYLFLTRSKTFRKFFKPRKIRFTREGVLFVLMTIAVGSAAINSGNNLLYLILAMMLSLIITSGLLSELNFRRVAVTRHTPEEAFAGEPFKIELVISNGKKRTPAFTLEAAEKETENLEILSSAPRAAAVGGGGKASVAYPAKAPMRGYSVFKSVDISSSYPFNFFVKTVNTPAPGRTLVYPRVYRVRESAFREIERGLKLMNRVNQARRGEEEFHGLREYRQGDSPRRIHWRTSAKKGELFVKEYEERRADRMVIALDTGRGAGFEDKEFEKSVSFAASVAAFYYRRGFEIGFYAFAPNPVRLGPVRGKRQYYRILDALALIKPSVKRGFAETAALPGRADLDGASVFAIRTKDTPSSRFGLETLRKRNEFVTDIPIFGGAFERYLEAAE